MSINNTAEMGNTRTTSRRGKKSAKVKAEKTAQVITLPVQESPESSAIAEPQSDQSFSLPGNVEISDTINLAGIRPIASSDFQLASTVNLIGMRPIGLSNLQFASTVNFSGIRPIASNNIDDIATLIGYLD